MVREVVPYRKLAIGEFSKVETCLHIEMKRKVQKPDSLHLADQVQVFISSQGLPAQLATSGVTFQATYDA